MPGRKKPYKPKSFESTGISNDTSANLYESMLLSVAFRKLTNNQKLLYVYMKKQYYGKRKPGRDYPEIEQLQGEEKFYFNLALAEKYEIYKKGNRRQFYKDIDSLESHGFIRTVSNGKATGSRSVYKFVEDWKFWDE